jgi:molecular chaperone GrpE (heat shock protein)
MSTQKNKSTSDHNANNTDNKMIMEELADDMLHLIEMQNKINNRLETIEKTLNNILTSNEHFFKASSQEINKLRTDLLTERKAFLGKSTFNALLPALESLKLSMENLDQEESRILYNQMSGISDLLMMILQTIGYKPFVVEPGEEFDTMRMECVGWEPGESGVVLRTERQGFMAGEQIAKPCQVIVGKNED